MRLVVVASISALFAGLVLTSDTARASDAPAGAPSVDTVPKDKEELDWSIGAGLSYENLASTGIGGLGPLPAAPMPSALVTLERRLSPALWFMTQATASVSHTGALVTIRPPSEGVDASLTTAPGIKSTGLGLSLGLRYVFVMDAPIEVSGYVLGSVSRFDTSVGTDIVRTGLMATAGLLIEHHLTDALSIRIGTSLMRGGWWRLEVRNGSETGKSDSVSASLSLSPVIELCTLF
jgi:hypothetical protein